MVAITLKAGIQLRIPLSVINSIHNPPQLPVVILNDSIQSPPSLSCLTFTGIPMANSHNAIAVIKIAMKIFMCSPCIFLARSSGPNACHQHICRLTSASLYMFSLGHNFFIVMLRNKQCNPLPAAKSKVSVVWICSVILSALMFQEPCR